MLTNLIKEAFLESCDLKQRIAVDSSLLADITQACNAIIDCVKRDGTVYSCGNGGSCCDAAHLTEELIARYKIERPGIKALHMGDAGTLTCWANDYSFDTVYQRQVETFCRAGDLLVAFSTSGNSTNIVKAVSAAKKMGISSIGLCGKGGGQLKQLCDLPIVIPSDKTERIQEAHILIVHIICQSLEEALFGASAKISEQ